MANLLTDDQIDVTGAVDGDILVKTAGLPFSPAAPGTVSMRPAWTNASGAPPVPAAGDQGRFWRQSDTGVWYVANFDGIAWEFQAAAIADNAFGLRTILQTNPAVQRVFWGTLNQFPVDYVALPAWTASVGVTGSMGTPPYAPFFYCLRQSKIAALDYGVDGLTYEIPAVSLVAPAEGWPGGADAGELVIPLTTQVGRHMVINARIRTNMPSQAVPGVLEVSAARMVLSRAIAADPNDPPDQALVFEFLRDVTINGGNITEATTADGGASYNADLNAEIDGGEVVRDVQFEIRGAQLAAYTGQAGGALTKRSEAFNHAENIATTGWILSLNGFHQDYGATPAGSFIRIELLTIDQFD